MNDLPPSAANAPQLRTLLLTDLGDATALVERIGDAAAAALFRDHDCLVLQLQQQWRGRLIDRSDGLLLLFERPIDGLGFALDYAQGLRTLGQQRGVTLRARQGLHVGEVLTWRNSDEAVQVGAKPLEVEGLAKPMAARLMSIARPGQLLLSAVAETLTHRAARGLGERGERLLWKSHGRWRFKGVPTPMEIYEVGEIGLTPLRAPRHSPKAWRDIPLWRRPAALVAELAVLAALGVGIWFITRAQPAIAFAERDWVVVGDVRNLTGNGLLDGSIDQAFRISLEQSRYVNVVSQARASSILAMMRKDPSKDVLDRDNAAIVATRLGARMVLLPSVADLGGRSRFSVEVVEPRTQQTVAISSAYASGASLLGAVDKVTADLRDRLGEDANSIRGTSQPLPEVTTSSLDALRAYSLGQARYAKGDYRAAVAFYQQAVAVDEHFALAWLGQARSYFASVDLRRATEALERALSLSARLPPREALYLKNWRIQILDPPNASQAWTQMAELYPDYAPASHNAALNLYNENRFDEALPYARAVAQSRVDLSSVGLDQYARILLALGQFKAADAALQRAVELGWNGALLRQATVAAAEKDFVRARQLMAEVHEDDYHSDNMRVSIALDEGDIAYATSRATIGMARSGLQSGVDRLNYYMPLAIADMLAGRTRQAMATVRMGAQLAVTGLDQDPPVDAIDKAATALALALLAQRMGDESISRQVLSQLAMAKKVPRGRVLDELTAVVEAEQQRHAGHPERSLEMLNPYLDRLSRVQTRVAALQAARQAGQSQLAQIQAEWLSQRRGLAYAEIECGFCLQALNILDVNTVSGASRTGVGTD